MIECTQVHELTQSQLNNMDCTSRFGQAGRCGFEPHPHYNTYSHRDILRRNLEDFFFFNLPPHIHPQTVGLGEFLEIRYTLFS